MTFPLKIVGLLKSKVVTEKVLITMTPTAGFTAGINLTFASGTLQIDWKDGSPVDTFVTGVEKTHTYASASTYVAEITGDLTNITRFIADNSRITFISGLKTGGLSTLDVSGNLYSGILDLSDTSFMGDARLDFDGNTNLTGVVKPTIASTVRFFTGYNCDLTGELDIDTIALVGGSVSFQVNGNPNLTSIKHAATGNGSALQYKLQSSGIAGTHDMKDLGLSSGGRFWVYLNSTLDDIIFATINGAHLELRAYLCNCGYVDCTNLNLARNNQLTYFYSNGMMAAEVNHILIDLAGLVTGESAGGDYTGRKINLAGTNAPPDGTSGGYDGLTAKTSLEGKGFIVAVS